MGLMDGLLGNAAEIKISEIQNEFAKLLAPGEQIEKAYKLIRDLFVFTNKRLILVDKQGLTGKKVEYHSIPYKSITCKGICKWSQHPLIQFQRIYIYRC